MLALVFAIKSVIFTAVALNSIIVPGAVPGMAKSGGQTGRTD
jgi:hypothetical protein